VIYQVTFGFDLLMRIRVKFFAFCRELADTDEIDLEVEEGTTGSQLWDILTREFPALGRAAPTTLMAVNMEYTEPEFELHSGDEVALIPPVSGGVFD